MKNLQPNLDAVTNIEVLSQQTTRILGLTATGDVVEVLGSIAIDDGTDGGGDFSDNADGENDITDMGGGSGSGSDLTGNTICYTRTYTDALDPCFVVGSRITVTDLDPTPTTKASGEEVQAEVTGTITSVSDPVTNQTSAPARGPVTDCFGVEEGQALPLGGRTYFEWECVAHTLVERDYPGFPIFQFDHWIDWPFEYPNGTVQWPLQRLGPTQDNQGNITADAADGASVTFNIGQRIYGRFASQAFSADTLNGYNDTPIGGEVTVVSSEGSKTFRKIRRLTHHPAPRFNFITNGYAVEASYPVGDANTYGNGIQIPGGSTSFTTAMSFSTGAEIAAYFNATARPSGDYSRHSLGDQITLEGADGSDTVWGFRTLYTAYAFVDENNAFLPVSANARGNGATTSSTTAVGIMALAATQPWADGTTYSYDGTSYNWDTTNRVWEIAGSGTEDLCADGGSQGVPSDAMEDPNYTVEICFEVLTSNIDSADTYTWFGTGSDYSIEVICAEDILQDGGDTSVDTRECATLGARQSDGIILNDPSGTALDSGTLGAMGFDIGTVDLNVSRLPGLAALTTSTTLEDVTDGTISFSNEDGSIAATIRYSSAALNGETLTLAGESGVVTTNLGGFASETGGNGTTANTFAFLNANNDPITSLADLSNIATNLDAAGNLDSLAGFRQIRIGFADNAAADTFVNSLTGGEVTNPTGFNDVTFTPVDLTITNGTNTVTLTLGRLFPNGNNSSFFNFLGPDSSTPTGFRPQDITNGAGSYDETDEATWALTNVSGGFENLIVTNAQGKWGSATTVQVCDDSSGGDLTIGGDGMFGGDLTVDGDTDTGGNLSVTGFTYNGLSTVAFFNPQGDEFNVLDPMITDNRVTSFGLSAAAAELLERRGATWVERDFYRGQDSGVAALGGQGVYQLEILGPAVPATDIAVSYTHLTLPTTPYV